jgi:hypothetical protein
VIRLNEIVDMHRRTIALLPNADSGPDSVVYCCGRRPAMRGDCWPSSQSCRLGTALRLTSRSARTTAQKCHAPMVGCHESSRPVLKLLDCPPLQVTGSSSRASRSRKPRSASPTSPQCTRHHHAWNGGQSRWRKGFELFRWLRLYRNAEIYRVVFMFRRADYRHRQKACRVGRCSRWSRPRTAAPDSRD